MTYSTVSVLPEKPFPVRFASTTPEPEAGMQTEYITKHEYLYLRRSESPWVYQLQEGFVRLGYCGADSEAVTTAFLLPGDYFGNLSLRPDTSTEFAQAVTPVTVRVAPQEHYLPYVMARASLMTALFQNVHQRLNEVARTIEQMNNRTVKQRILDFFHRLGERIGEPRCDSLLIPNFLTHETLGQILNASRQHVSLRLGELEQERVLQYRRRYIKLLK